MGMRPLTYKNFDKPCPTCGKCVYNKNTHKCINCMRLNRIRAVREKCAFKNQHRETPPAKNITQQKLMELELMGHPLAPKVIYPDVESAWM